MCGNLINGTKFYFNFLCMGLKKLLLKFTLVEVNFTEVLKVAANYYLHPCSLSLALSFGTLALLTPCSISAIQSSPRASW